MLQFASIVLDGVWGSIRQRLGSFDDALLTMRARFAILLAIGNEGDRIAIDVHEGCVTLNGEVASTKLAAQAVTAVESIGPLGVADRLRITFVPQRCYADAEIQRGVQACLVGARALRLSGIHVAAVYDGLVLLTGTAANAAVHLSALEAVAAVPGVRRVASEVTVPATGEVAAVAA